MSLFDGLKQRPVTAATCMLLDVSGSMEIDDGKGRRIDLLKEVVGALERKVMMVAFNEYPKVIETQDELKAHGGTLFVPALREAKFLGHRSVVLVTDGECSDRETVLFQEAQGMHIDVVYVGPAPIPNILRRLAARSVQGTVQIGKLSEVKQLGRTITGLLAAK